MKFSDTTNKNGIIQLTEDYADLGDGYISGDTTLLKRFTAYANDIGEDIWFNIWSTMGSWQFDDSNNTDLPVATTDIVSGQARYALPTNALTIKSVEVESDNGSWTKLKPFTREQANRSITDMENSSGTPMGYFLINDTIQLYPTPDYNKSDGLKVCFDRSTDAFLTTDTTKEPGIASIFHDLYPIGMAIRWLSIKQPQSPSLILYRDKYQKTMEDLKDYYAKRWEDNTPPAIKTRQENFE